MSAQTSNKPTFCSLMSILQKIDTINLELGLLPTATADAAGLYLIHYIYSDFGEDYPSEFYVAYGRNAYVEYYVNEYGAIQNKFVKTGEHACVLDYCAWTDTGASICFSDEEDYKRFMLEALEYGLFNAGHNEGSYYIPDKPIPNGGLQTRTISDEDDFYFIGLLTPYGRDKEGWYSYGIHMGI